MDWFKNKWFYQFYSVTFRSERWRKLRCFVSMIMSFVNQHRWFIKTWLNQSRLSTRTKKLLKSGAGHLKVVSPEGFFSKLFLLSFWFLISSKKLLLFYFYFMTILKQKSFPIKTHFFLIILKESLFLTKQLFFKKKIFLSEFRLFGRLKICFKYCCLFCIFMRKIEIFYFI